MKRREPQATTTGGPPAKLLHYRAQDYQETAGAPVTSWTAEGFTRWLRDRAKWRTHSPDPLPVMGARERAFLWSADVPAQLVAADREAPRPETTTSRRPA